MTLTWLGHACFLLETEDGSVVFDPYEPESVPGLALPDVAADLVLCSHGHHDHCHAAGVRQSRMRVGFTVETVESFHDDQNGVLRGKNTVHVIQAEGKRIVHMGDIGHALSAEQAAAIGTPDVLMIPVGGYYTVDAAAAKSICDALKPRTIVPMHYRGPGFGYGEIGEVGAFTALYDQVTALDTNVLDVTAAPAGVVVLKCPV
jgi:L-ascorbate metabolism protein UlaG (beta-lactamase superfamily)